MTNKNEYPKEYTGTWIPRHVMEDEELNATDRILYAEIASYSICYMSNELLATRANIGERGVQKAVKRLINKGYVLNVGFNGRQRFLKAVYDPAPVKADTNSRTSHELLNGSATNLSSSIDNIEKTNIKTNKKISDEDKFNVEKLYRGWLIEMVVGADRFRVSGGDPALRTSLLESARKKCRLTEKRHRKLLIRQQELGMETCIKAIRNIAKSPWHRGENENKWKASLEWLFNSTEKVEEWANK